MYKVAYLGPVVGRYTWLANEVLKSILYRYKNTGLLGHLFQDPIIRDSDSVSKISLLYTQEEHKRISSWS